MQKKLFFFFFYLKNSGISPLSKWPREERPLPSFSRLTQLRGSVPRLSNKITAFIRPFPTCLLASSTASPNGSAHEATGSFHVLKLSLEVFCFHLCCDDKNSGQEQHRRGRSLLHHILPGHMVHTERHIRAQKATALLLHTFPPRVSQPRYYGRDGGGPVLAGLVSGLFMLT